MDNLGEESRTNEKTHVPDSPGCIVSGGDDCADGTVAALARAGIDAGNQAWIDGVKTGNIALITATYAEDAVDCGPTGECFRGRLQIERHMRTQLTSLGRARAAAVKTWGSSQQGNFVYEWGRAEATFDGGKSLVDKYLTVWQTS